jgi:hypothetical protein
VCVCAEFIFGALLEFHCIFLTLLDYHSNCQGDAKDADRVERVCTHRII